MNDTETDRQTDRQAGRQTDSWLRCNDSVIGVQL